MPLEIKELTVRIHVQENLFAQNKPQVGTAGIDAKIINKIVQECTEKVLEIIERKQER
jgi:hypothetical protein